MTAILLTGDSFAETIAQGAPTTKGRAVVTFGHSVQPVGATSTFAGCASVGFQDEVDGAFGAVGFQHQYPHFEQSGSIGRNDSFYGVNQGLAGFSSDQIVLDLFGCGELGYVPLPIVTNSPTTNLLGLMLLSGITLQTKVGIFIYPGSGGTYSVTGLGFEPQLVLFSCWGKNYLGDGNIGVGDANWGDLSLGAYDGTNQWAFGTNSSFWLNGSPARKSIARDDKILATLRAAEASAVSLDADGFTLDFDGANDKYIIWHAFADVDGEFSCGTGVEGDTSIVPGFEPEAVLFANSGVPAFDVNFGGSLGFGGSDSALTQYAGYGAGGANTQHNSYWNTSAIAMSDSTLSGTPTLDAEATVTGMDASTVDLDWTLGGGGGMKFGWVALRTSTGPGFDGCGNFLGQIYRYESP